jgi:hypothetical protein
MQAKLVQRGWLLRTLEVEMPDGIHLVVYDGSGLGYEQVTVDRTTIRGSHRWYVPRFDFRLGGLPSAIEVRVWPWFALRSFALLIEEQVLYAEGVNYSGMGSAGLQRLVRPGVTAHRSRLDPPRRLFSK